MSIASAATPTQQLHGVNGAVTVTNGATETEFEVSQADWTHAIDTEDTTHSGAGGWRVKLQGVQDIAGTLTFIYDLANKPHLSPYQLKVGFSANLALYAAHHTSPGLATADDAQKWSGPAILKNAKYKTGPKAGAMEVTMDFESSGQWTIPTA